jgi:hypothetical protein
MSVGCGILETSNEMENQMTEKKLLADLTEQLVNAMYELDKVKYPNSPDRLHGWIKVGYLLSIGLDNGFGKRQLANVLQREIDGVKQELSDLSATMVTSN